MEALAIRDIVLSDKDFRQISDLVYDHCGINLHAGKKELVRARLAKRLRIGRFSTFPEYMDYVLKDESGKEFSVLIDSLSTNLTSFFREPQHFEFLQKKFIPPLLEQKSKKRNCKIRAWSAGCSSGEEPYSIAIALLELLQGHGKWDVKILATDISTRVIQTAKTGIYDEQRVSPVSTSQKSKYLINHRQNGKRVFQVTNEVKEIVFFSYLNLMEEWPIKVSLDFIFCRNVMIYFDKPTQSKLINKFWNMLDSGGILFTGHSESLTGIGHKFKYIQPTIYMKP